MSIHFHYGITDANPVGDLFPSFTVEDDQPPPRRGFRCAEGHVSDDYASTPGSILPQCPVCGRLVTQFEDTGEEPF